MSTHKHSEAGNELRSLSMIRYDQSMNATTQRSKDSHFWHLTPLPAHRQVHTSHTPTSGFSTENRIHVIRKLVPGLRTASDKASVASQCSLLPRRTIRSTGKGAIARRFKPALHAVSPH